jgi:hypothetical protein
MELHGGSVDSDSSYNASISYLVHPASYVWAGHADANYDLQGADDL